MMIVDAHEDIAFNALALKRDYTRSVAATRAPEGARAEDIATLGLPDAAAEWHSAGVRIIGPAWSATRYCGGTNAPGPLTHAGRALMREMSDAGLALDVSHLAEQSFWEALELFDGTVIASHSSCRAL